MTVGPLEEATDLRGLLIFRTDRIEHARLLMKTDPLVSGGFLTLELFSWFAPAGLAVAQGPPSPETLTFESD